MEALGLDLLTINGHKVHGPKGVGALYIRRGVEVAPQLHGGGHESGQRSGTLNAAGIAGFGEAIVRYPPGEGERVRALRAGFVAAARRALPGLRLHGPEGGEATSGTIINLALRGHRGKALAQALDRRGVSVSASSACHATKLTPSHVLLAMGLSPEAADGALRISLGRFNTEGDLDHLLGALVEIVTGT